MKPDDGYFQCPCCKACNDCDAGFQKILDLRNTSLVIYLHTSHSDVKNYTGRQIAAKTIEDVYILHNTKDIDIISADYLQEIEINAIPCLRCRKIVENAHKLLEKVPTINRNDVKGICEHCHMKATPCIKCKEVVKKFVANKTERTDNTKEKVEQWLSKVKGLLKDSVNNMGREKVRAHSELHIDELCRDVPKSREPEVKQMFHDVADFVGAFPPSMEKRKTMFAHASGKPNRSVVFIDQPDILGKPSTSRLNQELNIQDHDKGYYSDVDSEEMRTMFHPALTEEEKQRKSIKGHIPTVTREKMFDTSFENGLRVNSAKGYKSIEQASIKESTRLHDKTNNSFKLNRRVYSEETLFLKDENVTGDTLKRNFHFVFPKPSSPDNKKLEKQKSSSELIKDTQDKLLVKAEEDKKRREEEQIQKLEEEVKRKIALEEKKKELALKKADEEKRKHLEGLVRKDQEYGTEKKGDTNKEDTAKIDENKNLQENKLPITKEKETLFGTEKHTTSMTKAEEEKQEKQKTRSIIERETKSNKEIEDTIYVKDKVEKKSKKILATTKELEYKSDTDEKSVTKAEKQKSKSSTQPKEEIDTETKDTPKRNRIDQQTRDGFRSTKEIHEKGKVGTKLASKMKIKETHKESEPKRTKKYPESKENQEKQFPEVMKDSKESKEVQKTKQLEGSKDFSKKIKSTTEAKGTRESKEPKETKELKSPKDSKEPKETKELKSPKEAKELKKSKELIGSKESKEPSVDKHASKAVNYDKKLTKEIEGKLQKEEKEILKKEKDEQRQIEKENREKEKQFNKIGKHELPEETHKTIKLKQEKDDSASKQKELEDKTKQEKLVKQRDQVDAAVPPPLTVKIASIKVRRLSPDDLILRLVKLKQSNAGPDRFRDKPLPDMVSGKGAKMYPNQLTDANNMCIASDIDFEADIFDMSKIKNEKAEIIIGDKIFLYKKPIYAIRQDALLKIKEKEIRWQEICELARQKKLKQETEEAAAKKKKLENKVKEEKIEAERREKEGTGLSYMKNVDLNAIKVRRPSPDDLILQLVRLKQSTVRAERTKPKRLTDIKISRKDVKIQRQRKTSARVLSRETDSEPESEPQNELKKDKIAEIIIGPKISKYKPSMGDRLDAPSAPSYVQSTFDTNQEPIQVKEVKLSVDATGKETQTMSKKQKAETAEHELPKGVIRYALSDRTFIEKGWTMLPTEKVVRKMNVYRMRPAHPEFDWFEHNKNKGMMQYDTGEKLAEFNDEGRGRWFYRNGRMALDYYDAEELNAQQRFVIYSSGEPDERGRAQPYTLLATFDYQGNGVVFDHSGKIRLKYNQTEGVLLDRSIGPVSHWKWHTLNDPPVLQQVMIDTQMAHKDPSIIKLGGVVNDRVHRPDNEDMLAIEFDNFIKEKSKKLTQTFKPFQIKMKALKINEHFSLRVLDQATVYLLFRDGTTNLKLNIGMVLDHKEIVDTDTAEVGEVSTNMERLPAKTDSLAGLQRSVAYAERYERLRTERDLRIRPTMTRASVDKLVSAASRPMKAPLRLRTGQSSTTTDSYCKCSRKPSSSNIYYDTRLC